jgi:tetratricopeptide (TPR) repeat protein
MFARFSSVDGSTPARGRSGCLAGNPGRVLGGIAAILALILFGVWGWNRHLAASYAAHCQQAKQEQRWDSLTQIAGNWAQLQPKNEMPWLYLAEAAEARGDYQEVADSLGKLPGRGLKTIRGLLMRADVLFRQLGRPLEAEATCHQILELDPSIQEAHEQLLFFYAATLQRRKLAEQARSAIRHNCDTAETYVYLLSADWINLGNSIQYNDAWLKNDPESELFLVARALGRSRFVGVGESDALSEPEQSPQVDSSARTELEICFQRFPHNLELLSLFIERSVAREDVEEVARLLSQAPPAAVDDNRFWRYKGWVHFVRGEMPAASAAFEKALQINPFDWQTQHLFASVQRSQGQHKETRRLEKLAQEGKELRRIIAELPDVRSARSGDLLRMAAYAHGCGELSIARSLESLAQSVRSSPRSE